MASSNRRINSVILLCLLFHLIHTPGQANNREKPWIDVCFWHVKKFALRQLTEDWREKVVQLKNLETQSNIDLVIKPKRWFGGWGAVYPIEHTNLILPWNRPSVIKVPHTMFFQSAPLTVTAREMVAEKIWHDELHRPENLARLRSDKSYPKDPAWGDALPVLPLVSIRTNKGPCLIKPEIRGMLLDKIIKTKTGTFEMRKSLEDIIDLTTAISRQLKAPRVNDDLSSSATDNAFVVDRNPRNLFWVSDPKDLLFLGLSRPSFCFYEMTALHHRSAQKIDLSSFPSSPASENWRPAANE